MAHFSQETSPSNPLPPEGSQAENTWKLRFHNFMSKLRPKRETDAQLQEKRTNEKNGILRRENVEIPQANTTQWSTEKQTAWNLIADFYRSRIEHSTRDDFSITQRNITEIWSAFETNTIPENILELVRIPNDADHSETHSRMDETAVAIILGFSEGKYAVVDGTIVGNEYTPTGDENTDELFDQVIDQLFEKPSLDERDLAARKAKLKSVFMTERHAYLFGQKKNGSASVDREALIIQLGRFLPGALGEEFRHNEVRYRGNEYTQQVQSLLRENSQIHIDDLMQRAEDIITGKVKVKAQLPKRMIVAAIENPAHFKLSKAESGEVTITQASQKDATELVGILTNEKGNADSVREQMTTQARNEYVSSLEKYNQVLENTIRENMHAALIQEGVISVEDENWLEILYPESLDKGVRDFTQDVADVHSRLVENLNSGKNIDPGYTAAARVISSRVYDRAARESGKSITEERALLDHKNAFTQEIGAQLRSTGDIYRTVKSKEAAYNNCTRSSDELPTPLLELVGAMEAISQTPNLARRVFEVNQSLKEGKTRIVSNGDFLTFEIKGNEIPLLFQAYLQNGSQYVTQEQWDNTTYITMRQPKYESSYGTPQDFKSFLN